MQQQAMERKKAQELGLELDIFTNDTGTTDDKSDKDEEESDDGKEEK